MGIMKTYLCQTSHKYTNTYWKNMLNVGTVEIWYHMSISCVHSSSRSTLLLSRITDYLFFQRLKVPLNRILFSGQDGLTVMRIYPSMCEQCFTHYNHNNRGRPCRILFLSPRIGVCNNLHPLKWSIWGWAYKIFQNWLIR